ncbi:hypothetical protein KC360_g3824 [Hortaea werneckii]|nr:hypothetical protein KC325_g3730 [Hortaea werneckii]KAI6994742.1 hypothetical protein KC359_g4474 [Hortaea werneckii]KAI7142401.1 hypothetical protein KC344_g7207 [Hortaea werneckii]KAI7175171.1 hypothetical protein KC360_g3824 [Hortaea werneckii]
MSTERSSSAVRNLRSIFENKGSDNSPDGRGRSTSGLSSEASNSSRPTSRIRANFVSVEPPKMSALAPEEGVGKGSAEGKRESTANIRRGSFTVNTDEEALALKETVSEEAHRREEESKVAQPIPEAAVESSGPTSAQTSGAGTALMQADHDARVQPVAVDVSTEQEVQVKEDKEPANPDKPTTAAEEEPVEMRPAEPANEEAVSGGQALPPVTEDLRHNEVQQSGAAASAAVETPEPKAPEAQATATQAAATEAPAAEAPSAESVPTGPLATEPPVNEAPATAQLDKAAQSAKKPEPEPKETTSAKSPSTAAKASPKPTQSASTTRSSTGGSKSPAATRKPASAPSEAPKPKQPVKKPSRTSLTAPTASSTSKAHSTDRTSSTSSKPPTAAKPETSKPKTTKPMDLPSRLTAPTASSRAKHEPESAQAPAPRPSAASSKPSAALKPKPKPTPTTSSARPTPRSSLAPSQRPESRTSATSAPPKKPAPADGSFLERMMRPTAASANKTHDKHDKTEMKSPPRPSKTTAPLKPKTNGQAKKPAAGTATGAPKPSSRPSTAKSGSEKASSLLSSADAAPAAEQTNGTHEGVPAPEPQQAVKETLPQEPSPAAAAAAAKSLPVEQHQQSGIETPPTQQSNGAAASPLPQEKSQQQGAGTTLEATPVAIGEELR